MLNHHVLNVLIINVNIVPLHLHVQFVLIMLHPKMANALIVKLDFIKLDIFVNLNVAMVSKPIMKNAMMVIYKMAMDAAINV